MNKQELLRKIKGTSPDVTMKVASATLNAALSVISDALANGEKVTLMGFGTFDVRDRQAREGRSPATGEKMVIPAARVVGFKVGKELKDKVAG